jgi:hypothetical protein
MQSAVHYGMASSVPLISVTTFTTNYAILELSTQLKHGLNSQLLLLLLLLLALLLLLLLLALGVEIYKCYLIPLLE